MKGLNFLLLQLDDRIDLIRMVRHRKFAEILSSKQGRLRHNDKELC